MNKRVLGQRGENLAREYLMEMGYRFVEANYRCEYGEIDLVMEREGVLVFCEVKLRRNEKYGMPVEAVDRKKMMKIRKVVYDYLMKRGKKGYGCRIDVIGVLISREVTRFTHFRGVG